MPAINIEINDQAQGSTPTLPVSAQTDVVINVNLLDGLDVVINAQTQVFNYQTLASQAAINAAASETTAARDASRATFAAFEIHSQYLGAYTLFPPTDSSGNYLDGNNNPVTDGALYYGTTNKTMYVWNAGTKSWDAAGGLGAQNNGNANRLNVDATGGETLFNLIYTVGFVDVWLNGIKLEDGVDFTALDGTTLLLNNPLKPNDILDVIGWATFDYVNSVAADAAQIKLRYESNPDTNAYTDVDKATVSRLTENVFHTDAAKVAAQATSTADNAERALEVAFPALFTTNPAHQGDVVVVDSGVGVQEKYNGTFIRDEAEWLRVSTPTGDEVGIYPIASAAVAAVVPTGTYDILTALNTDSKRFTRVDPVKYDVVTVTDGLGPNAAFNGAYFYDGTVWNVLAGAKNALNIQGSTKLTRAAADVDLTTTVMHQGSVQGTLENLHKELKMVDSGNNWVEIYSEDKVKAWIAAGSLFQGTTTENDLTTLPAPAPTNKGWYWTWVGAANYTISGTDPVVSPALDGVTFQVGDWLQSDGTSWTHVPGDLLSRQRWDNLGSFKLWADGSYEQGSLVRWQATPTDPLRYYVSTTSVVAGDLAPSTVPTGAAVQKWQDITPSIRPENLAGVDSTATLIDNGVLQYNQTTAQWEIVPNFAIVSNWVATKNYQLLGEVVRAGNGLYRAIDNVSNLNVDPTDPANGGIWQQLNTANLGDLLDVTVPPVPDDFAAIVWDGNQWTAGNPQFSELEGIDKSSVDVAKNNDLLQWDDFEGKWVASSIVSIEDLSFSGDVLGTFVHGISYYDDAVIDDNENDLRLITSRKALQLIGESSLSDLSDTKALATVVDGQGIAWDAATSGWIPAVSSAKLDDLTDVDTTTIGPVTGDLLTYDTATNTWKPQASATATSPILYVGDAPISAIVADIADPKKLFGMAGITQPPPNVYQPLPGDQYLDTSTGTFVTFAGPGGLRTAGSPAAVNSVVVGQRFVGGPPSADIADTATLDAFGGATPRDDLVSALGQPPVVGSRVFVGCDSDPSSDNTKAGVWRYDGTTFQQIQTAVTHPTLTPAMAANLASLVWDPETNSMVWHDDRDAILTVPDRAGLLAIPVSHLKPGKLVFERDTNQLWEFIAAPAAMTRTLTDWKPAGGDGVKVVNRVADLQLPAADPTLKDGALAAVRFHADAVTPFNELFILRSTPPATTGGATTWRWLPVAPQVDTKPTRAAADIPDPQPDDIQVTTENGHKEIKLWDAVAGTWVTIYSEDQVQSWIAAGNLFVGTAEETGHGIAGAIDLGVMPAESALGATDKGHYWTWVGTSGHTIKAAEIGGAVSTVDGAQLNVGDWIQVAEGTPGVYTYTVIPGDLLAKARGDSLYGLNVWASGAYEQGALVVHQGKIYKATRPVIATDPSPDTAGSGWQDIQLSAGVRNVPADGNLPPTAPAGDVYLVVNSAKASGKPAFYTYDTPTGQWIAVGGGSSSGSLALDISTGGDLIFNVGCPVGSVMMWAAQTPPQGWLFCDGQSFNAVQYSTLNSILGGNSTPNLINQFVRAADPAQPLDFAHKPYTTGRPKTLFTGHTSTEGNHNHGYTGVQGNANPDGANDSIHTGHGSSYPRHAQLKSAGTHSHTVLIDTGGDAETAPDHILLYYIIKAEDDGMNTRLP